MHVDDIDALALAETDTPRPRRATAPAVLSVVFCALGSFVLVAAGTYACGPECEPRTDWRAEAGAWQWDALQQGGFALFVAALAVAWLAASHPRAAAAALAVQAALLVLLVRIAPEAIVFLSPLFLLGGAFAVRAILRGRALRSVPRSG